MKQGLDIAIYLRKSRADVEEEQKALERGETFDTLGKHRRELLSVARRDNHNVVAIYEEVVSGAFLVERPEMLKLLEAVQRGDYDGVLVVDVDRFGRGDKVDQGRIERAFKQSNTLILTPTDIFDMNNDSGELNVEMRSFIARLEYNQIKKRLHAGLLRSTASGKDVGNKPPYGYKKNDQMILEVYEPEAEIVRKIYDWSIGGMGRVSIAQKLTDLAIPSPSGKEHWSHVTVLRILKNEKYKGDQVYGRNQFVKQEDGQYIKRSKPLETRIVRAPNAHDAIVSPERWEQAQESIRKRTPPSNRHTEIVNVFAGIIRCKKCGMAILANNPKNRPSCYLYCQTPNCNTKMIVMTKVEKAVLEHLHDTLRRIQLSDDDKPDDATALELTQLMEKKKALDADIMKNDERRERLHTFLEDGTYDKATFLQRMKAQQERQKQQETELESIMAKIRTIEDRRQRQDQFAPLLLNVLEVYRQATSNQHKNDILRSVIRKIEYEREKDWNGDMEFNLWIHLHE